MTRSWADRMFLEDKEKAELSGSGNEEDKNPFLPLKRKREEIGKSI